MANTVSAEKRRWRPFFIVVQPALSLACIIATTWVLLATQRVELATPLVVISFGPARRTCWVMLWLSTPAERKLFQRRIMETALAAVRGVIEQRADKKNRLKPAQPRRGVAQKAAARRTSSAG